MTLTREMTIEVASRCLCFRAQRAARALARRFDKELKPFGITSGQFSMMMSLNRAEPPRPGDLADFLAMDRTTVTAGIKALQRNGLVEVRADPKDARGRRLHLTQAGRDLLARAMPVWRRAHDEIDSGLQSGAPDLLRDLLGELTEAAKD